MKPDPKRPYKAFTAFVLAFLGELWAAVSGTENLDTLDWKGWLGILIGALVIAGGVFAVPNPSEPIQLPYVPPPPAG